MRKQTCRGDNACHCRAPWLCCVLSATLLTAGCIPTRPVEWVHNGFQGGPRYERPPAPVAPEWIEAQDARVQGHVLRDGDWWNVFQDPILDSLIHAANQQNLTLHAVGMRVLE